MLCFSSIFLSNIFKLCVLILVAITKIYFIKENHWKISKKIFNAKVCRSLLINPANPIESTHKLEFEKSFKFLVENFNLTNSSWEKQGVFLLDGVCSTVFKGHKPLKFKWWARGLLSKMTTCLSHYLLLRCLYNVSSQPEKRREHRNILIWDPELTLN